MGYKTQHTTVSHDDVVRVSGSLSRESSSALGAATGPAPRPSATTPKERPNVSSPLSRVHRWHQRKGLPMVGAGGLVVSIIAFAVGAILDWAVTVQNQHGINVNKVGAILMIVGVVGAVISIIVMVAGNTRRQRTVVDDGQGNVVRRVDSTY